MKITHGKRPNDFYEQLAPLYHLKVDWEKRLPKETPLFDFLFSKGDIAAVCDLGCGDGGHAGEIAGRGAMYFGIDNSAEMIKTAKRHYQKMKGIQFLKSDMLQVPAIYNRMFDVVLLLGNTLPHMLTDADMKKLFAAAHRLLGPHGRFIIQSVNPGKLKSEPVHFLPPKLAEKRVLFTPLYVRQREAWDFLMPIYVLEEGRLKSHSVLRTRLRFWTRSEVVNFAGTKFRLRQTFGDAQLSPYHSKRSENMILTLERI